MEKKTVRLEELLPVIEETLRAGGTVKLPITGTSMLPLLVAGRDTVTLSSVTEKPKKFDVPFYRRRDGAFVLHRIVACAEDNTYTLCGDNQWVLEKGVRDGQMIGLVSEITRNGKTFSVESKKYKHYVHLWHMLFPIRKYIVKLRGKVQK